jgi:hypothetical protein
LTAWRDSSLALWNLADAGSQPQPVYRVTPHHARGADVDVGAELN